MQAVQPVAELAVCPEDRAIWPSLDQREQTLDPDALVRYLLVLKRGLVSIAGRASFALCPHTRAARDELAFVVNHRVSTRFTYDRTQLFTGH